MKITLANLRDWDAYYPDKQLLSMAEKAGFTEVTPLEFAALPAVSVNDKLRTLLRPEIIPEKRLHLLTCDFADVAFEELRKTGQEPHPASIRAIESKRKWVVREITDKELDIARNAAGAIRSLAWNASGKDVYPMETVHCALRYAALTNSVIAIRKKFLNMVIEVLQELEKGEADEL